MIRADDDQQQQGGRATMASIWGGREEPSPLEPQTPGIAGRANDMLCTGFDRRADVGCRVRAVIREVRDKHG